MSPFARWLADFLTVLLKRLRPMNPITLSPETQAKIDKAFADKATAVAADAVKDDLAAARALAVQAEQTGIADAAAKHAAATDSAHDAIAALSAELNFPLPG